MKELLNLLENIWAIPKNRKMILLFLGVSIVVCIFVLQAINIKQDSVNTESEALTSKEKNKDTMLQQVDANKNKIMKDPFAVPSSFQKKVQSQTEEVSKNTVKNQKTPSTVRVNHLPIVTGIIGSGDRFIAIIKYGEVSKQYSLDDFIGPYTIVEINQKNVVLSGPSGIITLTVGR